MTEPNPPRSLTDLLLQRQRDLGFSDGRMASALGVPRTTYSAVKTRRGGVSLTMARKIAQAFPDLAGWVLIPDPPLIRPDLAEPQA